jgi:hypothetical protein
MPYQGKSVGLMLILQLARSDGAVPGPLSKMSLFAAPERASTGRRGDM